MCLSSWGLPDAWNALYAAQCLSCLFRAEMSGMIPIILACLLCVSIGLLFGGWHLLKEQSRTIDREIHENGLLREEVKILNDSIARAGRTPIIRPQEQRKALEPSESWFDGKPKLTSQSTPKVTMG